MAKTNKKNKNTHISNIKIPDEELFDDKKWEQATAKIKKLRNELKIEYNRITDLIANSKNDEIHFREILLSFEYCNSLVEELFEEELNVEQYEEIEYFISVVDYFYERVMVDILLTVNDKHITITDTINKQQGIQFATFSIFLTILSSVLANVIIISKGLDLKTIILCNLSILLFATVLFNFIIYFYKIPDNNENIIVKILKRIAIILLPILIMIAIIVIFKMDLSINVPIDI